MLQEFVRMLNQGNIIECRAILANEILWNNSAKEKVYQMISLGDKNGLFEEHNGEFLDFHKEVWNADYLNQLNSDLAVNFSRNRYELAYQVALHLNKDNRSEKEVTKKNYCSSNNVKNIVAVIGVAALVGIFLMKRYRRK